MRFRIYKAQDEKLKYPYIFCLNTQDLLLNMPTTNNMMHGTSANTTRIIRSRLRFSKKFKIVDKPIRINVNTAYAPSGCTFSIAIYKEDAENSDTYTKIYESNEISLNSSGQQNLSPNLNLTVDDLNLRYYFLSKVYNPNTSALTAGAIDSYASAIFIDYANNTIASSYYKMNQYQDVTGSYTFPTTLVYTPSLTLTSVMTKMVCEGYFI